jgi:hypothetical protein
MRLGLLGWSLIAVLGAKPSAVVAQCAMTEEAKLIASDGEIGDAFGISVSLRGDVLAVGASGFDDNGDNSGAAYVFRLQGGTWVQEQKLLASDGNPGDRFGEAVSVSDNVVVIGALLDRDVAHIAGAAYVFRYNGSTWVEEQKLTASDAAIGDLFGTSACIDGDTLIIGAPSKGLVARSGSAYIFRYEGSSWVEKQKLVASDTDGNDDFGHSVSLSGNVAVVGEPEYGVKFPSPETGSAYVFRLENDLWVEEAKLTASDAAPDDWFGISVAVDGEVVLVGSLLDDDQGARSGSAYVYRFDGATWIEEQKLLASDGASCDMFGSAVSLCGDVAVVGAHGDSHSGIQFTGSAYVFRFNGITWQEVEKLTASDAAGSDLFGHAVSVEGGVVAASAAASSPESVYVYRQPGIVLDVEPETAVTGDTLAISTCGGIPGHPVMLFVVAVNGSPRFQPVLSSTFDVCGRWNLSPTVPTEPNLPGSSLMLRTLTLGPAGNLVQSNDETVSVQ